MMALVLSLIVNNLLTYTLVHGSCCCCRLPIAAGI